MPLAYSCGSVVTLCLSCRHIYSGGRGGGGGFGMTPWCDDLVCSWRRLLADRHSLPFPWTLSLHRRWCPSASHHPLTFLFLLALTFPLPSPFPSLGLSLCRPPCPSASPHSFPSLSLGRLCQRSPRTCPVSLLCVESTQRKANAFAVVGSRWWGGGGSACGEDQVRPTRLPRLHLVQVPGLHILT